MQLRGWLSAERIADTEREQVNVNERMVIEATEDYMHLTMRGSQFPWSGKRVMGFEKG